MRTQGDGQGGMAITYTFDDKTSNSADLSTFSISLLLFHIKRLMSWA